MTETHLHKKLKEIGMAFLFNQNCFLVASEVHINRGGQKRLGNLDKHFIIDVCGVGEKYIPLADRMSRGEIMRSSYEGRYKYNVVRGIEVKVSHGDFKNGFICSGCNYHYLLSPEGLVWSYEIPQEVGVIKVDLTKFSAKFISAPTRRFSFTGLRILRKPTFRNLEQYQIDNALSSIAKRSTAELINRVATSLDA